MSVLAEFIFAKWLQYKKQEQLEQQRKQQQANQQQNNPEVLAIEDQQHNNLAIEDQQHNNLAVLAIEGTPSAGDTPQQTYNWNELEASEQREAREQQKAREQQRILMAECRELRQQLQAQKVEFEKKFEAQRLQHDNHMQRVELGMDHRVQKQTDQLTELVMEQRTTIMEQQLLLQAISESTPKKNNVTKGQSSKDPMWASSVVGEDPYQQTLKEMGRPIHIKDAQTQNFAIGATVDIVKAIDKYVDDYEVHGGTIADRNCVSHCGRLGSESTTSIGRERHTG